MTNVANFPLLSLILFMPLVGAAILVFVPKENGNLIRWIANIVAIAGFVVSLPLWFWYNPQDPSWQFVERATWIPSIGAQYFPQDLFAARAMRRLENQCDADVGRRLRAVKHQEYEVDHGNRAGHAVSSMRHPQQCGHPAQC